MGTKELSLKAKQLGDLCVLRGKESSSRNNRDQLHYIAIFQNLIIQNHFAVPCGDHRFR